MHYKNRKDMYRKSIVSRGFTLIELLVVIAIIGILASIVLASLNVARQRANVVATVSDLRQITTALYLYRSDNNEQYPCFDHNWDDTKETEWAAPYLEWPTHRFGSASNNKYHWEHMRPTSAFSISLREPGDSNALALDKMLDDGNLTTGLVQGNGIRLEYSGMDQLAPTSHTDDC